MGISMPGHHPDENEEPYLQCGFAKANRHEFTEGVLWNLIGERKPPATPGSEPLLVGSQIVPLKLVRHPRARRYLLRVLSDGTARLTVPRRGSFAEARRFAGTQTAWIGRQLQRLAENPVRQSTWRIGTEFLFRGETVTIESVAPGLIRFGVEQLKIKGAADQLRPVIQSHLHRLAKMELPPRVMELAAWHELTVRQVSVRNQRSRWGSCSRRGAISLNWRLLQAPEFVRDYIILHELMHLRQMNHSARFWKEVERVCPNYQVAERWLKQHSKLLH
jgi:predicted metal-dependent hydrolase